LFLLFWTLSGISPANRSRSGPKSVHMHRSCQGSTKFTKFWARLLSGGEMQGSDVSPTPFFFVSNTRSLFGNFATADFRFFIQMSISPGQTTANNCKAMTRDSWLKRRFWTEIYEKFPFRGHLPPKPKLGGGHTCTSLRASYRSSVALQRDTVYSISYPRAREFPRSGQLFYATCGCRATGRQNCPIFRIFGIFSPYKTPTKVPSGDQPTGQGYISE